MPKAYEEIVGFIAAGKATATAEQMWNERGLSNKDMDAWLNG